VLGTPKPSIQWYKDDVEIFSCDRIEMREEEEGGAVIVKAARSKSPFRPKTFSDKIFGIIFFPQKTLWTLLRKFIITNLNVTNLG
jgi:hypothetical protein